MQDIQFQCSPEEAKDEVFLLSKIKELGNVSPTSKIEFRWKKRSVDARKVQIKINCTLTFSENKALDNRLQAFDFKEVENSLKVVHIIGGGPAGMFAALRALELGLKPVIFERGKDVRNRRRDLAILNKEGIVNPESNYCFGEGGAGTYSDGKLYTRSKKRGDVDKILQLLVYFCASE